MEIELVKGKQKTKHVMPTNWDNISLDQYVRMIKKTKEVGLRELEKVVDIINILTNIDSADLYRLSTKNIAQLGGYVTQLLNDLPNEELKHVITIDGIDYGFHPQLSEMTMGEWVDIDTYISEGLEDNLHKIMSVLYRPILEKVDEKYCIEEYRPCKERQELFREKMNVGDFYAVSVFFSLLGRELLQSSLKYSITALKEEKMPTHSDKI
ncbi:MAG: hypothetical protein Unbinned176contig1000_42 [Prokaryotic dsDNA virus sp.]|nr:MAG: hypothetical protein Unbinned176contig1000_42 [Prokaryotic dsDNA virus sp.]|tara:strand:+ start:24233 stop:24862 length:630 start_codon:yes stop_codon:yes gene_type:complete